MAMRLIHKQNGEVSTIPRPSYNQQPLVIVHDSNENISMGGSTTYSFYAPTYVLDKGGYFDPSIDDAKFFIPYEGIYSMSAQINIYNPYTAVGIVTPRIFLSDGSSNAVARQTVSVDGQTNILVNLSGTAWCEKTSYISVDLDNQASDDVEISVRFQMLRVV